MVNTSEDIKVLGRHSLCNKSAILRGVLKSLGKSYGDLAEDIGVSQGYVSRMFQIHPNELSKCQAFINRVEQEVHKRGVIILDNDDYIGFLLPTDQLPTDYIEGIEQVDVNE